MSTVIGGIKSILPSSLTLTTLTVSGTSGTVLNVPGVFHVTPSSEVGIDSAAGYLYFSNAAAGSGIITSNMSAANAGATAATSMIKIYPQNALDATDWVLSVGTAANAASLFNIAYNGAVTVNGALATTGNLSCAAGSRLGFNGATTGFVYNGSRVICEAPSFTTQPGTGSGEATIGGQINVNTTSTGSGAGASDLITYSMPANTLVANGRGVRIKAWGTTANNANAKTVALIFGGTTLITKQLSPSVAGIWTAEAIVIRTGANAQLFEATAFNFGGATPTLAATDGTGIYSQHAATTCAETETATITIKGRATAATSANDIVQKGLVVTYI